MQNVENQKIRIHIKYKNEMTIYELGDSLQILNYAFTEFYERYQVKLSDSNVTSPRITSVSNGSFVVDVIVPISCALLPILYDIIKNRFYDRENYTVDITEKRLQEHWTAEDNYKLSKAVLEEYTTQKSSKSMTDFIDELLLVLPHKRDSIKAKIQNTKYLLVEKNVQTTLSISPLKNCSKAHREQFERVCTELSI